MSRKSAVVPGVSSRSDIGQTYGSGTRSTRVLPLIFTHSEKNRSLMGGRHDGRCSWGCFKQNRPILFGQDIASWCYLGLEIWRDLREGRRTSRGMTKGSRDLVRRA